jgi:DNA-directed RNA polymerase specialized sigma24 family protein
MTSTDFARLIDAHAAPLVLYARQWCGAPEDVVQEAFVKLVRQRRAPEDAVAWLYRVVGEALRIFGATPRRPVYRQAVPL